MEFQTIRNIYQRIRLNCGWLPKLLRRFIPKEVDISQLIEAVKANNFDIKHNRFVNIMSMKFLPTSVEIPEKKSAEAFFDDLRKPTELGVGK